jgi:hypothetical protein
MLRTPSICAWHRASTTLAPTERHTAVQCGSAPCTQPKDAEASKPALDPVPDIEWWDVRICVDGASYDAMAAAASGDQFLLRDKITNLVSVSLDCFMCLVCMCLFCSIVEIHPGVWHPCQ